jgi:Uma2 family endonuclease
MIMATVSTKLMTVEQFWVFVHRPENRDRSFDLVRGEVVEMSKPGRFHGFVCGNIAAILFLFARKRKKGYVCSNDTGVIIQRDPDTVRGPDVLFFEDVDSSEKMNRKWGADPPRFAVEVMSPNDTMTDLNERIADQLICGTPLVWLLDPERRKVTVYRPNKPLYVLNETDEIRGEDVLRDFRCQVAEFFKLPAE